MQQLQIKILKTEEYIRIKDLENRQKDLFEVHLFSWEDIVDLIDENKQTHDWYLNLQKFKQKSDVFGMLLKMIKNEIAGSVPFCLKVTHFRLGEKPSSIFDYTPYGPPKVLDGLLFKGENKSYFRFRIKIKNIGSAPIENPKLIIQADGNQEEIGDEYIASSLVQLNAKNDIKFNETQGNLFINPHRNVFAPEEEYISDIICIKPIYEGGEIELSWKLISNNFKKEGFLKVNIQTYLIQKDVDEYVDFRQQVRIEKNILDFFEKDE